MTSPPPRRAWWTRKLWRFALAFWLVMPVAYVAAYGPIIYACCRGWLGNDTWRATYRAYEPLSSTLGACGLGGYWEAYHDAARARGFADEISHDGEIGGYSFDVF